MDFSDSSLSLIMNEVGLFTMNSSGFCTVAPAISLALFSPSELSRSICGSQEVDLTLLKSITSFSFSNKSAASLMDSIKLEILAGKVTMSNQLLPLVQKSQQV